MRRKGPPKCLLYWGEGVELGGGDLGLGDSIPSGKLEFPSRECLEFFFFSLMQDFPNFCPERSKEGLSLVISSID